MVYLLSDCTIYICLQGPVTTPVTPDINKIKNTVFFKCVLRGDLVCFLSKSNFCLTKTLSVDSPT